LTAGRRRVELIVEADISSLIIKISIMDNTTINMPESSAPRNDDSGFGVVIGVIIAVLIVIILFMFGISRDTNVEVPAEEGNIGEVEIDVNLPTSPADGGAETPVVPAQ